MLLCSASGARATNLPLAGKLLGLGTPREQATTGLARWKALPVSNSSALGDCSSCGGGSSSSSGPHHTQDSLVGSNLGVLACLRDVTAETPCLQGIARWVRTSQQPNSFEAQWVVQPCAARRISLRTSRPVTATAYLHSQLWSRTSRVSGKARHRECQRVKLLAPQEYLRRLGSGASHHLQLRCHQNGASGIRS